MKLIAAGLVALSVAVHAKAEDVASNLAPFATPSTSYVSGHERLAAINDGFEPRSVLLVIGLLVGFARVGTKAWRD